MTKRLQNWGRSFSFEPTTVEYPDSEAAIVALVKRAHAENRKIRLIGSGHSWTHLIKTSDILVSLDRYQGLIKADHAAMTAEVKAGTKLLLLGNLLNAEGMAMENLGDIDVQSIAGAMSTGTHGAGKNFGTLATQIAAITLITGTGEVVTCSETEQPELFKAAQVSLGALGILSRITLKTVPTFKLEYISKASTVQDVIENYERYNSENRNFEFYYFPYTSTVQLKLVNKTDAPIKAGGLWRDFNDVVVENVAYQFLSSLSKNIKPFTRIMCKISAAGFPKGRFVNYSNKIFATKRWVRFYEMEYNVPAEHFKSAFQEIIETIENHQFRVHMPIEVRFVKGDDILISPTTGRDSVYIAVHQYEGMDYKPYFEAIESIFLKYNGRPHFGKMNTLNYQQFRAIHPNWDRFCAIRQQTDPQGVFLNEYLQTIFNVAM